MQTGEFVEAKLKKGKVTKLVTFPFFVIPLGTLFYLVIDVIINHLNFSKGQFVTNA